MKKNTNLKIICLLIILLVVASQIINIVVENNIYENSVTVIDNVLKFTYVENTGGAFGVGQNDTLTFVVISILVLAIILHFIISQKDRIDRKTLISVSLIISGGASNLIDRIFRGFVLDYIDISPLVKFPVFNLADTFVFIGWVMLVISIFIYWKDKSEKERALERKIENERKEINDSKDSRRE